MMARLANVLPLIAALLAGCSSAPVREGDGDTSVVQFIDVRNQTGEPVTVTARVGANPELRLGFMEPAAFRRFEIPTGAASDGTVFLRALNPQTGREATQRLQLSRSNAGVGDPLLAQ